MRVFAGAHAVGIVNAGRDDVLLAALARPQRTLSNWTYFTQLGPQIEFAQTPIARNRMAANCYYIYMHIVFHNNRFDLFGPGSDRQPTAFRARSQAVNHFCANYIVIGSKFACTYACVCVCVWKCACVCQVNLHIITSLHIWTAFGG